MLQAFYPVTPPKIVLVIPTRGSLLFLPVLVLETPKEAQGIQYFR